jgi:hypothetical protein
VLSAGKVLCAPSLYVFAAFDGLRPWLLVCYQGAYSQKFVFVVFFFPGYEKKIV